MNNLIFTVLLSTLLISTELQANHNFISTNNSHFYCKVITILDGDTIKCLRHKKILKIRLSSIDAPEKGQRFGKIAKKHLSNYIANKNIIVSIEGVDKYRRYLAEIFLPDHQYSINYLMVKKGWAWSYDKYVEDLAYISASRHARRKKVGLWQDNNPIEPEYYRHHIKKHRKLK
ncbi:thermonuclease family protein [Phocoenobacter skyensis]|uniref:thermonuclease family protein n=1 Tax=Phocoenobacter skyensis TaxID=97481 RepID=UPI0027466683|nr:thermonuclease family protein [Pasteurella skyensis]MDP8185333.1 thermonuclease family protein [Pasteurella skyensis]